MAVTLNKANLVLKDANGNIGKIEQLSNSDLAKIKTAMSDVALVVNQSNHKPIVATTTNKGVVQLATSADISSGAIDKVVTAEQLHNATTGTSSDLAAKNLARIDAVVTEAGIPIDHTNTNQLKTAVTTLVNQAKTDASQKYYPLKGGALRGSSISRNVNDDGLYVCGGAGWRDGGSIYLSGKDNENGTVTITAHNGTNFAQFRLDVKGLCTWNGKNIVRSVNNINADNLGNVTISTVTNATNANHATSADSATNATNDSNGNNISNTYYPLTGGALIGQTISRNVNDNGLYVCGGTGWINGGSIYLRGKDNENGKVSIDAHNGTKYSRFEVGVGYCSFNDKNIVRSVNNVNANGAGNVTVYPHVDYGAGISLTGNNATVPADGILICRIVFSSREGYFSLKINGISVASIESQADDTGGSSVTVFCSNGDTITTSGSGIHSGIKMFYPFKS